LEILQAQKINDSALNVKVKRNVGDGEFVGINFVIDDGDNVEVIKTNTSLNELETKNFYIFLIEINASKIKKISIVPVFRLESGKEVNGDVKDEYTISSAISGISSCTPNCVGKVCGSDGCGGSCGSCSGSTPNCINYQCSAQVCTPSCLNKQCGSDGCSGTCGSCSLANAIASCSGSYQCVISSCNSGYANCDGNISNGCETQLGTNSNCASCGNACTGGQTCTNNVCVTSSSGNNYYVSNSGSDSNPGTLAQPWAHHPWMSTWTGSIVLVPGDTVYMKRGDTWSIANPSAPFMTVGQSGSAGLPITTTAYGTGNKPLVQITGDYNYPVIKGLGKSYITFDNIEIKHFSSTPDSDNGQDGIYFAKDSSLNVPHDWIITNCNIHNIPETCISGLDDSYNIIIGNILATATATKTSYSNHIYDCGYAGVMLLGRNPLTNRSDFNVYYNYIHNIGADTLGADAYGIAFSSNTQHIAAQGHSSGWPAYCTARYNYVDNVTSHTGIDSHGGSYIYFQDNYVKDCHTGIVLQSAYRTYCDSAYMNHSYIERNTIENSGNDPMGDHKFIVVVAENVLYRATDCYVTDNVLFYTTRPSSETYAWGILMYNVDGVTVEGNKVYNGPVGDAAAGIGVSSSGKSKNVIIKNNWVDNWDQGIYFLSDYVEGNITLNNNTVLSHQKPFAVYDGTLISGDYISIYNNTFLTLATAPYPYSMDLGGVTLAGGASLIIENNTVGVTSTSASGLYIFAPATIIGTFTCDYNSYWNSTRATPFYRDGVGHTFAQWQTHGDDVHGTVH
jgi:hypothetical protein